MPRMSQLDSTQLCGRVYCELAVFRQRNQADEDFVFLELDQSLGFVEVGVAEYLHIEGENTAGCDDPYWLLTIPRAKGLE